MQSLKELYKIGHGPSSSHTMGPSTASMMFKRTFINADTYKVILYGSLALTGKGHLTDQVIKKVFAPSTCLIEFNLHEQSIKHPNTLDLYAYQNGNVIGYWRVYSIGGGSIEIEGQEKNYAKDIYPYTKLDKIKEYCLSKNIRYCDYVYRFDEENIKEYLYGIWKVMKESIANGLSSEGTLPGPLQVEREAKRLLKKSVENPLSNQDGRISAYAYAVCEYNAIGGVIVTSPTCGASGVVPAVLYDLQERFSYRDEEIIDALATAGLFGNLIKENASISGAECGCQAEIGSACAMAAAACAQLKHLSLDKIEDAAEMGMENHLGLTCDPIYGYVQIPCIQRNAVAAIRAIDIVNLAELLLGKQKVSFDMVVDTMYETGRDLRSHYRETSKGGLAKKYCKNKYSMDDIEVLEVENL